MLKINIIFFSLSILMAYQCSPSFSPPSLEVIWENKGNVTKTDGKTSHTATFTLINRGKQTLNSSWAMHWNQAPRFVISTEGPADIRNINGDFYKMTPATDFLLKPGDSISISYTSGDWLIKESDAPLGVYLEYTHNGKTETAPVKSYTIRPFTENNQYTRSPEDMEPFPEASYLYDQYAGFQENKEVFPFLPAPESWKKGDGEVILGKTCSVSLEDASLESRANYLKSELKNRFGIEATIGNQSGGDITLGISAEKNISEAYTLAVKAPGSISIYGSDEAGVFYGIQSLLSLAVKADKEGCKIPVYDIQDKPAFGYRGLHIDVCRNFQNKETILRMIDMMARYKLNRMLFNLTEDEGWRIDIKGLPELTEVGARRGHLYRDSLCLPPAYGSGPDPADPASHGNGYYTREDFKEIITYAKQRNIEVIPEINLPGHSRAAIRAMELRYQRLMKEGKKEAAEEYRLIDPADTSRYISAQGYNDNTACVCQGQVFHFFETVVDDIISMYKEANVPLRMFHTGGDEVPSTAWTGSPICKEFLKKHPEIKNTRNLQGMFFGQMEAALTRRGLATGAWEEAVMVFQDGGQWNANPTYANKQVYPYVWNSLWGNQDLGYRLANAGYPIVLCNVTNFYFDLAYSRDPREPGLYWGGFVDHYDAFSFIPYDLYQSVKADQMGRPFNPAVDFKNMERLSPTGKDKIAGLQAQLWSETVKGRNMLEYYYLPKLQAFAQRAWQGQPAWAGKVESEKQMDWSAFMHTLAKVEVPFMDSHREGYHYRIPPPGIKEIGGSVFMNSGFPGMEIRYTTDGTEPTKDSPVYMQPFQVFGNAIIKASGFSITGRSGLSSTLKI
jgi:hexosaminidase